MRWQCWGCSSDDGCELGDLVGGDPVHEPDICPWSGGKAWWKRVDESAAENKVEAGQPATNKPMVAEAAQISPCQHEWIQACTQMVCRKCRAITDD